MSAANSIQICAIEQRADLFAMMQTQRHPSHEVPTRGASVTKDKLGVTGTAVHLDTHEFSGFGCSQMPALPCLVRPGKLENAKHKFTPRVINWTKDIWMRAPNKWMLHSIGRTVSAPEERLHKRSKNSAIVVLAVLHQLPCQRLEMACLLFASVVSHTHYRHPLSSLCLPTACGMTQQTLQSVLRKRLHRMCRHCMLRQHPPATSGAHGYDALPQIGGTAATVQALPVS